MIPAAPVWLRWAQFIDLALVFGAPLTAWLLGERRLGGRWRGVLAGAGMAGIALAGLGFLVTLAGMAGGGIGDLDRATLAMMLWHSALGWSVLARLAGLAAGLGLAAFCRAAPAGPVALAGGLAVASLAWSGHAAASQGGSGMLRLAGDIAHLWCGLAWLGALMLFTADLWRARPQDRPALAQLERDLGAFALVGSVLVGVLTVSGLANLLFLAPSSQWAQDAATPYGRLILAKLALFGLMFVLAAHNRFRLVPALARAGERGEPGGRRQALFALRRSIGLETVLAGAVVWCVAWAGTLDPSGGAM